MSSETQRVAPGWYGVAPQGLQQKPLLVFYAVGEMNDSNLLPFATYIIIMDNNTRAHYAKEKIEEIYEKVASSWPNAPFARPTTVLISKKDSGSGKGKRVCVTVYRDGVSWEEI